MTRTPQWRTETRLSHLARRVEALPLEKRVLGRRLLRALRQAYGVMVAYLVLVVVLLLLIVVNWPSVLTEAYWRGVVLIGMVALSFWATQHCRKQSWLQVHAPDLSDASLGPLGKVPQEDAQVWNLCEESLEGHLRVLVLYIAREFALISLALLLTRNLGIRFDYLSIICLSRLSLRAPCWLLLRNLLAFLRGTGLPAPSPAKRGLRLLRGSPARGQA